MEGAGCMHLVHTIWSRVHATSGGGSNVMPRTTWEIHGRYIGSQMHALGRRLERHAAHDLGSPVEGMAASPHELEELIEAEETWEMRARYIGRSDACTQ